MWRSLKPYEKQSYIDVAISMKPNDQEDTQREELYQKQGFNQYQAKKSETPQTKTEIPLEMIPTSALPKIQVIARSGKWKIISSLSQTVLYQEDSNFTD